MGACDSVIQLLRGAGRNLRADRNAQGLPSQMGCMIARYPKLSSRVMSGSMPPREDCARNEGCTSMARSRGTQQ